MRMKKVLQLGEWKNVVSTQNTKRPNNGNNGGLATVRFVEVTLLAVGVSALYLRADANGISFPKQSVHYYVLVTLKFLHH